MNNEIIKSIELITSADIPNFNGYIYSSECMQQMTDELNRDFKCVKIDYYKERKYSFVLNDAIATTIPKTFIFEDGKIKGKIKIIKDVENINKLLNDKNYTIGTCCVCRVEDKKIVFDDNKAIILYLAIFNKNKQWDENDDNSFSKEEIERIKKSGDTYSKGV